MSGKQYEMAHQCLKDILQYKLARRYKIAIQSLV